MNKDQLSKSVSVSDIVPKDWRLVREDEPMNLNIYSVDGNYLQFPRVITTKQQLKRIRQLIRDRDKFFKANPGYAKTKE